MRYIDFTMSSLYGSISGVCNEKTISFICDSLVLHCVHDYSYGFMEKDEIVKVSKFVTDLYDLIGKDVTEKEVLDRIYSMYHHDLCPNRFDEKSIICKKCEHSKTCRRDTIDEQEKEGK